MRRLPAEEVSGTGRIGDQAWRVTLPPGCIADWYLSLGDGAGRLEHLAHRKPFAVAQVQGDARAARKEVVQTEDVRLGKVGHVHVVTHAGPVGRRIVGAEDRQVALRLESCSQYPRDQMALGIVPFTDSALRIGAGRVEIAEPHRAEAVSALEILEDLLDHRLAPTVGIHGLHGAILDDPGGSGVAVHGS